MQVKSVESEKELQISANKEAAQANMARESELKQAQAALKAKLESMRELRQQVEEKKKKLDELSRQTSVDITLALLQTACAQAEEDSENIAKDLLSGKITFEEFLKEFPAQRKTYHLRRIKADKLSEYVRNMPNQDIK